MANCSPEWPDFLATESDNRLITLDGKTMCVVEWAEQAGLKPGMVFDRLALGWSLKEALGPKRPYRRRTNF